MHTQLALAHHNIEICPAVYAIVEQLNTLV
jgi:hypothetical protein